MTKTMAALPQTQHALQLTGPDSLVLNTSKKVLMPARHQILCRVEAVGLCFSDLKLLRQFSHHPRKGQITSGIDQQVLKEIPSYVPGEAPTVPGHETTLTIEALGPGVEGFKTGQRYILQPDYRWLHTTGSNAAFGYNFEGALQEYVLFDERVITSPQGQSMLFPVSHRPSASAAALVEPWACVEDAYAANQRQKIKSDGLMLVVADAPVAENVLAAFFDRYGKPAQVTWLSKFPTPLALDVALTKAQNFSQLGDASYDDCIYFGSHAKTVEALFAKLAPHGLFNIVLCGGRFGSDVTTPVGRLHYAGLRIIGTAGIDPAESMQYIPQSGEIRPADRVNVVGAAGPIGTMHVIRNICRGIEGVSIFAADVDENRLSALSKIAGPLAEKNSVRYKACNPLKEKAALSRRHVSAKRSEDGSGAKSEDDFDYIILMVPAAELVAASIKTAAHGAIINVFAGIPELVSAKLDLDAYISKKLYFIATSGSVPEDMQQVLAKVESRSLDTNVSVAAVCGLDGAADGIRAVENRSIVGKIIVYPACKGLGLTTLEKLAEKLPKVADCLNNGLWTKEAELKLLQAYSCRAE
jgi:threonine dehydrogenase-like Zn-dependent dehydrogenase